MKTPEGKLKDLVKAWLKSRNAYFYMPVPGGYGKQTLDFLCCVPYEHVCGCSTVYSGGPITEQRSKFVGIETKAPGKKPTPRQEQCMREIVAAGGVAFWCDSYQSFLMNIEMYGLAQPDGRNKREQGINYDQA